MGETSLFDELRARALLQDHTDEPAPLFPAAVLRVCFGLAFASLSTRFAVRLLS